MESIVSALQNTFPDANVAQKSPPSYLKCHIGRSGDIVLVTGKQRHQQSDVTVTTPRKREQSTMMSEYEVTGSPLKLDMDFDKPDETLMIDQSTYWTQDENLHLPLSVADARNVVNLYNSKISALPAKECTELWVICDTQDANTTFAIGSSSSERYFNRSIVFYTGVTKASDLDFERLKEVHRDIYGCPGDKPPTCTIEGIYRISGKRTKSTDFGDKLEISNRNHNGMTQLECQWSKCVLHAPLHDTKIKLVQEVIIGHDMSSCTVLWKSICAIQGIRNALLNLTNILTPNNIANISIKPFGSVLNNSQDEFERRLQELLDDTENYSSLSHGPKGGCICISEDNTNLQQVFKQYANMGSSNDFTYKLWDILKDCNTVEDLITTLVHALKNVYKRNLRPFIDPGNTTFIGGLVKKLARGLSQQAVKSLSSFRTNPTRALNIIGQLGIAKLGWEYTNIFSLVDNALGFNDRLRLQNKVSEINEEVFSQTILDMTLGSGDVTVNPFDTKFNLMDSTLVHDAETTLTENVGDLTLDNFASLKKHNIEIVNDRKLHFKDQPLISDDADIEISSKEWKFKLTRLTQLHVCLEHLYRAQLSLNCDFNSLREITTQLLDFYTNDESPIKTVAQLHNEPLQVFSVPIQYKHIKEHLQYKHATMYRITLQSDSFRETKKEEKEELYQTIKSTFIYSQQNIFPPSVYIPNDADSVEEGEIIYYSTKCIYLSNRL